MPVMGADTANSVRPDWATSVAGTGNGDPNEFFDIDADGLYNYGWAERLRPLQAVIVDRDGDGPGGIDNGPFSPSAASGHSTTEFFPVWKPGERFIDMDGDGRWDGMDEANNLMDWDGNGQPDLRGPWVDLDSSRDADAPSGCSYLPDSDNDGNPDCCPNGPSGEPDEQSGCGRYGLSGVDDPYACPSTHWSTPTGDFIDPLDRFEGGANDCGRPKRNYGQTKALEFPPSAQIRGASRHCAEHDQHASPGGNVGEA